MSACSPGARTSWTARTTTATESRRGVRRGLPGPRLAIDCAQVMPSRLFPVLLVAILLPGTIAGQGVRDHTRPAAPAGTAVSESQATDLTLTLSTASLRLVQTLVRTAGMDCGRSAARLPERAVHGATGRDVPRYIFHVHAQPGACGPTGRAHARLPAGAGAAPLSPTRWTS